MLFIASDWLANKVLPADVAACTIFPGIAIGYKWAKEDKGLRAHEAVHSRQMLTHLWLPFILQYKFNAKMRYRFELEACRAELAVDSGRADGLAAYLHKSCPEVSKAMAADDLKAVGK